MILKKLTVTTPASSYDLTTLADVKVELGISGTTYDTLLSQYITAESLKIQNYCGGVLVSEVLSEQFRLTEEYDHLQLSRFPVSSIASVTVDDEVLDADEYECDLASGLLYCLSGDSVVGWGDDKITVVYTAGYSTIPEDLQEACTQMVKMSYSSQGRDPALKAEEVPGVGRQEFWVGSVDDGMASSVDLILDKYRRYQKS